MSAQIGPFGELRRRTAFHAAPVATMRLFVRTQAGRNHKSFLAVRALERGHTRMHELVALKPTVQNGPTARHGPRLCHTYQAKQRSTVSLIELLNFGTRFLTGYAIRIPHLNALRSQKRR